MSLNKKAFGILMVLAMLFWASSWPCSKILVEYAPPHFIAFWRFFFVLLYSLVLIFVFKLSLSFDSKSLGFLLLAGLCNLVYSYFFFAGLNYAYAGKGGVLVTTMTPIFAYLLVLVLKYYKHLRYKEKFGKISKNELIGLILGIISGFFLLDLQGLNSLFAYSNIFFLLAAFDWALMSIFTAKIKLHPLVFNFYVTLIALLGLSPFLLNKELYFLFEADERFWLNLQVVVILSTLTGTIIYYKGIAYLGVVRTNSFLLLVPAFALVLSYFILGEVPSKATIFGAFLAIFAIYLINIYGKKNNRRI